MPHALVQLAYTSRASQRFTQDQLPDLLHSARNRNAGLGITGMLMYDRNCFFQVLEGPRYAVLTLYDAIKLDQRHTSVERVMYRPVPQREFGDWAMALAQPPSSLRDLTQGLSDFFRRGVPLNAVNAGEGHLLLNAFRKGMWRIEAI